MVMERLDAAGRHPENQDPTKQFAIKQAKHLLREAKVKDPGPKGDERLPSVTKSDIEVEDPLQQIIEVYNTQPHTPEFITSTHQAIWKVRGELVGTTYEITPCPYTQEELTDLETNGKRIGYLPKELATQQNRHVLGKMFPKMRSHSVPKRQRRH